jgi:dienelactone hydrolase
MTKFIKLYGVLAAILLLTACQTTSVTFSSAKDKSSFGNLQGLLAKPDGKGPFPAVVLLHTCGGVKRHVSEDWPNYLTSLGYVVLTVDTMGVRGYSICTQMGGGPAGAYMQSEDAYGALDYLATLPYVDGNRVGVMGFSMGAMAINNYMVEAASQTKRRHEFKAAIAAYGHCRSISFSTRGNIGIPLMELVGELDSVHGPSCIEAGKNKLAEVNVLKATYHAFDQSQFTNLRYDSYGSAMLYSSSAHSKAEELTKAFLAKHLSK